MTTKACRKCGKVKPVGGPESGFHKHPKMADGHLNTCKTCHNAYTKSRPRDPAAERDRLAAWRAAHPERWKELRAKANKTAQTSGTAARSSKKRQERLKEQKVGIVRLADVLALHGRVCSICAEEIRHESQLTLDHVVPLARGGAHSLENLRPAHRACNSWKGDRLPDEVAGRAPPDSGEVNESHVERRRAAQVSAVAEANKRWFANATPEQKAARGAKISATKTGKKHPLGHKTGGARVLTPEQLEKRGDSVRATYATWTPERREAHAQKVRDGKARTKAAAPPHLWRLGSGDPTLGRVVCGEQARPRPCSLRKGPRC